MEGENIVMNTFIKLSFIATAAAIALLASGCEVPGAAGASGNSGSWGTAALIETDDTGDAYGPRIAGNGSGGAIAVWTQWDGSYYTTTANMYSPLTGWLWPVPIETTTGDMSDTRIAFDPSGNAMSVWCQYDGAKYNIWANRYVRGTGWSSAFSVETSADNARGAQVGLDDSGKAMVIWHQDAGTPENIWARRYIPGTGWEGAPVQISDSTSSIFTAARLAVEPSGNAFAVWVQYSTVQPEAWANRYIPGWGWGTPVLLNTDGSAVNGNFVEIDVDGGGNAIAVWQQTFGGYGRLVARRFVPASGWLPPEGIDTINIYFPGPPQVAFGGDGSAVAVWAKMDETGAYNLWAGRYTPGSGWGPATPIGTAATQEAQHPQVACDASGRMIVTWYQSDGVRNNIWANAFAPGTGWGTAVTIETGDGTAYTPTVAFSAEGQAAIVWSQSSGTRYNIWTNSFRF
jgi:hypothetical protein